MKKLGRFSIGTGDRFGREGVAQLSALKAAVDAGVEIDIVWNKSNREHTITHTAPEDQRRAADEAIKAFGWRGAYFVDADHINIKTVDKFIDHCDFFTLDVADFIGKPSLDADIAAFTAKKKNLIGELKLEGLPSVNIDEALLRAVASKYLVAVKEASALYNHIVAKKGKGNFITEVSMDETAQPQSPAELYVILSALADEGIPVDTIAPKFSGRFNKGVDYVGNVKSFMKEFEEDVCVAQLASKNFGLPAGLKLSVHSGSDKFSLYPGIQAIVRKRGAGVHLKTAGTTWLEELVGLAEGGGDGLVIAKEVYRVAFGRYDELVAPYAEVVDIDKSKLPSPDVVDGWTGDQYAKTLRHVQSDKNYNLNVRQMLHVGYKVAVEMGARYFKVLETSRKSVEKNVKENLLDRHMKPLFLQK
ncbi:MAG: tagaturonate epimerase family protein [Treponemataceae bacterium]